MYIEIFLLYNAIMNYLILRLSWAFCSVKISNFRMFFFAFMGALYAWLALFHSVLASLPGKLLSGMVPALAFPLHGKAHAA